MEDYLNKYDWVAPFNQGVAIVVKDDKYGAILTGGQEIIEPSYEYISSFKDGFAQAIKNGQCLMIDLSGSECKQCGSKIIRVPKEYDVVRDYKDGFACVQKDGKWGVIDTDCKEIIPPKFFYISDFAGGTAKYKLYDNKQWGYLNSEGFCSDCNMEKEPEIEADGTLIIERYEIANKRDAKKERRRIKINNYGDIIVKNRDINVLISREYNIARDFFCGVACVQNKDGYWGAIDERGNVIVPFEYCSLQDFAYYRSFGLNKNSQLCLISASGSILKEFEFSWDTLIGHPFEGEYAIIEKYKREDRDKKDKKVGILDRSGKEILKLGYDSIIEIKKDQVIAYIEQIGQFHIIVGQDYRRLVIEGQTIYLPEWSIGVKKISDELYSALSCDGKWGIINPRGETLCDPIYDRIGVIHNDIIVGESQDKKWYDWSWHDVVKYGLYNRVSGVSIPAIYDACPEFEGEYYKIISNGLYGILSLDGIEILKPEYKDISYDKNGYFIVSKWIEDEGIKQGLACINGEIIYEPQFDIITVITQGLYRICKNKKLRFKWALFNNNNQISKEFEEMGTSVSKGLTGVTKYEESGFISKNGAIIIHSNDKKQIELPAKFSWGKDFTNGVAAVWVNGHKNYVDQDFNLVINHNGKVVQIKGDVDYLISVEPDSNDGFIFIYQKKKGLLSKDGMILIYSKYDSLSCLNESLYVASIKDDDKKATYGVVSTDGNIILPFVYESIKPFDGKARKEVNYIWDEVYEEYYEVIHDSLSYQSFNEKKYWIISKGYNQYGLIDNMGNICLEAVYRDIVQFGNILLVEKDSQYFILDKHFEEVQALGSTFTTLELYDGKVHKKDPFYDDDIEIKDESIIEPVTPSNNIKYGLLHNNYCYGLIDENGIVCIDTIYQNIVQFQYGFYVKLNDRWGILNEEFQEITEPKYDSIKNYREGYNKIIVKDGVWEWEGVIDKYGHELLKPIYRFGSCINGNVTIVQEKDKWPNPYGLVNDNFEFVAQPEFSSISANTDPNVIVISKKLLGDELYGLMNEKFEIVVQPEFSQIQVSKTERAIIIAQKDGNGDELYGLMNEKFEVVAQPVFSHISEFENGKAFTKKRVNVQESLDSEYQYGYLDKNGKFTDVLDTSVVDIPDGNYSFGTKVIGKSDNLLIVQITDSDPNNQYCAIINNEGKVVLPFKYHSIEFCYGGTFKVFFCGKHKKYPDWEKIQCHYLLDGNFTELTPELGDIQEIDNKFVVYQGFFYGGRTGLMDHNGNLILPYEDSQIKQAERDRIWICKGKYGLATIDGKVLTDCKYSKVESFIDGRAIVDCGSWHEKCINYDKEEYENVYEPGPFGVIDLDGNEIISPVCESITYDNEKKQFTVTKLVETGRSYYHRFEKSARNNSLYHDHGFKEKKTGRFDINGYQIIKDANGNDIKASKKFEWQDDYDQDGISAVYYHGFIGKINDNQQLVATYSENDEKTSIIIPTNFDWAHSTNIPAVIVEEDEKLGVLSSSGQVLIACSYESIEIITHNEISIFVCSNSMNKTFSHVVYNHEGREIISSNCREVNYIGCGLLVMLENNGKRVIRNFDGKKLADDNFDNIKDFGFVTTEYHPYGYKEKKEGIKYAIVSKNEKYGAINNLGQDVVPIKYNSLRINENNTFVADGALIDINGQRIVSRDNINVPISTEYEDARLCSNGLIIIKKDNLYGCITQDNKIIIPIAYSRLECYNRYLAAAILDDEACHDEDENDYEDSYNYDEDDNRGKNRYKYGVINYSNEVIIPFNKKFDDLIVCDHLIKYRVDKKWGVLTLRGDIICEPNYHYIDYLTNNLIRVGKNRMVRLGSYDDDWDTYSDDYSYNGVKWGIIDFEGNIILPMEYDEINTEVDNGRIMIHKGWRKGFLDVLGNVLLSPTYYSIGPFVDGFSIVSKQYFNRQECEDYYRYGVIDCTYHEVIPCVFSSIQYEKDSCLFKTEKGYKTLQGKSVVEFKNEIILVDEKYAYCSPFNNGSAIATKYVNGKAYLGLINSKSEDILPPIFRGLQHIGYGLYRYKINEKYGVADDKGNIVLHNLYDGIGKFDGNLALVKINNNVTNKGNIGSTLYGFINSEGKMVLPAVFDFVGKRSEGCSVVRRERDGAWGIFNCATQEVIMIEKATWLRSCIDGLCLINVEGIFDREKKTAKGGKWGYVFTDGKTALSPIYDFVGKRSDGYSVIEKDNEWGVFNLTSHEVKMIKSASYMGSYRDGLCSINIGGIYDRDGKTVDGGKWGFIDIEGTPILPVEYDFIGKRSENYSVLRKDLTWGLFNLVTHEVQIIEDASWLGICKDGLCRINVGGSYNKESNEIKEGEWGYLDPDNGIIIAPKYSNAHSFSDSMAAVKMNDKWGFINKKGDLIVPCEYDEVISNFSDGKGELLKNDYIYVFDKDGKNLSSRHRRYDDEEDDDDYDYGGYDDYDTPTYDKYGGPGGYSDQTIDDAFGGDPSLLWNID